MPRGKEIRGVHEALVPDEADATTERESIQRLQDILDGRPEVCVAVVCHWGVIHALCDEFAGNGAILECVYTQSGRLEVIKHHRPRGVPRIS